MSKNLAAQLVTDLLSGLSPDEARALIAAEEQRRADDEAQREAARAALLMDRQAEERRLRADREKERQQAERARNDARKRAIEARQSFDGARAALLSAAGHLTRAIEAHRRAHDKWVGLVDRAPGEALPWDRPAARLNEKDAVTLRELERAG